MEETISRMAGSENGSAKSVAELVAIAEGIAQACPAAHHHLRATGRLECSCRSIGGSLPPS